MSDGPGNGGDAEMRVRQERRHEERHSQRRSGQGQRLEQRPRQPQTQEPRPRQPQPLEPRPRQPQPLAQRPRQPQPLALRPQRLAQRPQRLERSQRPRRLRRHGYVAGLVVAVLWAWAATARADVDSPLVQKGMAAYADLDYGRAVQLLEQARGESLTREEKLVTYRTLGLAYAALGNDGEAKKDFQHLLRIDPNVELDRSVAPKVRALFEEAKAQAATSDRGLQATLPAVTPRLEPATPREGDPLTVHVAYPGGVARKMTLFFRSRGAGAFARATSDAVGDGRFAATVPGQAVRAPELDYHVVLLDDAGASVAAAGSLGAPLVVGVRARPVPVYKRGWFWGVLVGVAAVGATAAVLAVELPRNAAVPVTVNAQ